MAHRPNPNRKSVGLKRHRLIRHRPQRHHVQFRPLSHQPKRIGSVAVHKKPSRPRKPSQPSNNRHKTVPRKPSRPSNNRNNKFKNPSHKKPFKSIWKPKKVLCGYFNGVWKTFRNIHDFYQQRRKGYSKSQFIFIDQLNEHSSFSL